jgi:DNA polymerase III subunit gamma/tau
VYGTVDAVVEAGHDPRRFAADLLDRFRDLIVVDAVPDAPSRGLIYGSPDELVRMSDQAARIGAATLARNAEIVHTALIEMRGTTSPRLVLELLCARMLLPDAAADSAALLQRIERLERRNAALAGEPAPALTPAPTPQTTPTPTKSPAKAPKAAPAKTAKAGPTRASESEAAPSEPEEPRRQSAQSERPADETAPAQPDPQPGSGTIDAAALRRLWPDVLDVVKQSSRRTRALLDNAQVASVDGNRLTVSAATAPLAKMISEDGNVELLRTALTSIVGGTWQVDVAMTGGTTAEPDPRDESREEAAVEASPGDPEAEALSLLRSTLGVRPIDE